MGWGGVGLAPGLALRGREAAEEVLINPTEDVLASRLFGVTHCPLGRFDSAVQETPDRHTINTCANRSEIFRRTPRRGV